MIKEEIVTYETAKVLKEKGFNEKCWGCYTTFFDDDDNPRIEFERWIESAHNNSVYDEGFLCSAPTHQMVLAWLRSKGLYVDVDFIGYESEEDLDGKVFGTLPIWQFKILSLRNGKELYADEDKEFYDYEKTIEAAINYCLENFIK